MWNDYSEGGDNMKLKLEEWHKYKFYIILGGILLFFILIFSGMYLVHASSSPKIEPEEIVFPDIKESTASEEKTQEFVVDVKGAVVNPGVYKLPEGSYVYQAIEAAGGLLETANTNFLNLSKRLDDSMVIIVYTQAEIDSFKEDNVRIEYVEIEVPCICPDTMNDACIEKIPNEDISSLISINIATVEELLNISGIGESKAKAIVAYREENGLFERIDDIKNVSGIGEALFEKIKNQITV